MRKTLAIPLQHVVSCSIFAQLELAAIGAKFKKRPGVKNYTHHKAKEAIAHMVQETYSIRKKKF